MSFTLTKKPQPSAAHEACWKCNGTGFFCLGIHNGQPYSNTGFSCYSCGGAGWVAKKAPSTPAPASVEKAPAIVLPFKSQADAKRQIQALIDASDRAVCRAILAIYRFQTETEKAAGHTVEDNGVGFSGADSELLTSFAQSIVRYGSLTPKQMPYARKKIRKYHRQLRGIIESKQEVPA